MITCNRPKGTISNALRGSPVPLLLGFRHFASFDFEIRYGFKILAGSAVQRVGRGRNWR